MTTPPTWLPQLLAIRTANPGQPPSIYANALMAQHRIPTDGRFREQVRTKAEDRRGVSIEDYLRKMDAAGIERSFLIAVRCGDLRVKGSIMI